MQNKYSGIHATQSALKNDLTEWYDPQCIVRYVQYKEFSVSSKQPQFPQNTPKQVYYCVACLSFSKSQQKTKKKEREKFRFRSN